MVGTGPAGLAVGRRAQPRRPHRRRLTSATRARAACCASACPTPSSRSGSSTAASTCSRPRASSSATASDVGDAGGPGRRSLRAEFDAVVVATGSRVPRDIDTRRARARRRRVRDGLPLPAQPLGRPRRGPPGADEPEQADLRRRQARRRDRRRRHRHGLRLQRQPRGRRVGRDVRRLPRGPGRAAATRTRPGPSTRAAPSTTYALDEGGERDFGTRGHEHRRRRRSRDRGRGPPGPRHVLAQPRGRSPARSSPPPPTWFSSRSASPHPEHEGARGGARHRARRARQRQGRARASPRALPASSRAATRAAASRSWSRRSPRAAAAPARSGAICSPAMAADLDRLLAPPATVGELAGAADVALDQLIDPRRPSTGHVAHGSLAARFAWDVHHEEPVADGGELARRALLELPARPRRRPRALRGAAGGASRRGWRTSPDDGATAASSSTRTTTSSSRWSGTPPCPTGHYGLPIRSRAAQLCSNSPSGCGPPATRQRWPRHSLPCRPRAVWPPAVSARANWWPPRRLGRTRSWPRSASPRPLSPRVRASTSTGWHLRATLGAWTVRAYLDGYSERPRRSDPEPRADRTPAARLRRYGAPPLVRLDAQEAAQRQTGADRADADRARPAARAISSAEVHGVGRGDQREVDSASGSTSATFTTPSMQDRQRGRRALRRSCPRARTASG